MKIQIDIEKETISFPNSTTQEQIKEVFELFYLSDSKWQVIMNDDTSLQYYTYSNSTYDLNKIKSNNYYTTI